MARDGLNIDVIRRMFRRFPSASVRELEPTESALVESILRRRVKVTRTARSATIRTLIATAEESTGKAVVFLQGGAPRDIVRSTEPNDVDAAYVGTDIDAIKSAMIERYGQDTVMGQTSKVIGLVGVGVGADSFDLKALHLHECYAESPANSLMIHVGTKTLIDPFGQGVDDARNLVWRIPCSDRDTWADYVRFGLWRMLKFRVRGYRVPDDDMVWIYEHFVRKIDEHHKSMWSSGPLGAFQTVGTAPALSIACSDLERLYASGALRMPPHEFLLKLVERGVLSPPDPVRQSVIPMRKGVKVVRAKK